MIHKVMDGLNLWLRVGFHRYLDILVVHGILVFIPVLFLLIKALNRLFSRDIIFCPDKRIAFAGVYALLFQSFFENGFIVTPYSCVFFVLMLAAV